MVTAVANKPKTTRTRQTKTETKKIKLKRVYDPASKEDGTRILVDRLWPRGIKKEDAQIDLWLKEIAPSTNLRKWFCHDPAKWEQFEKAYFKELDTKTEALSTLSSAIKKGPVTLLFGSKELEYNNAVSLKHYLEKKRAKRSTPN